MSVGASTIALTCALAIAGCATAPRRQGQISPSRATSDPIGKDMRGGKLSTLR